MDEEQMTTSDPMDRLERKIDALAEAVHHGFARVDKRLTNVETRLASVEATVKVMQSDLSKVRILAVETDKFAKNVWDSLTSLTKNMTDGFDEAKKERKQGFSVVHAAVLDWGKRVRTLETASTRATKRRP